MKDPFVKPARNWDKVKLGQKVYFGSSPNNMCGKVIFKLFGNIWVKTYYNTIRRIKKEWFIMDLAESIIQKEKALKEQESFKEMGGDWQRIYYWNIAEQARNKEYIKC